MGGYENSHLSFNNGGDSFNYSGGTVGASISYITGGGFFIDGLFKADLLNLSINTPTLSGNPNDSGFPGSSISVDTYGGIGNIGYRFDTGSYFFEPIGTLTYSQTQVGSINAWNTLGANLGFGNGSDFRGALGGRIGIDAGNWIGGHVLEASLTGRVWDQFNGNNNSLDIVNAGPTVTLNDKFEGVFGEVKGGLTLTPAGGAGWSVFANAGVKFNDQFTTVTAKGGVAYAW